MYYLPKNHKYFDGKIKIKKKKTFFKPVFILKLMSFHGIA